eukprot:scaffold64898_cov33-Phaeocystis_antarctica.AAC.1
MNDIYMLRVGKGLYDVPLDGPKPRFGQQRRKKSTTPLFANSLPYGSTLDLRGFGRVVQERRHGRGLFAAAARAATPEASLARAPSRSRSYDGSHTERHLRYRETMFQLSWRDQPSQWLVRIGQAA